MPKSQQQEDRKKIEQVEKRATPPSPIIYQAVRRNGEEEMARPAVSLWWSGLAAGLSISFSLVAQAILLRHLPETAARELLVALGYPIGFLIVILGRQQLFTENTITVVLPVMASPTSANFGRAARNWAIVLSANLTGTFVAAAFATYLPAVPAETFDAMLAVSEHAIGGYWFDVTLRGVGAGFLMASLVWMLPGAGHSQTAVILIMTWLIAVGGFAHIVAGSIEAWFLLLNARLSLGEFLGEFFLPSLAGNVVGGTAIFALLAYAQVMKEIPGR
ncbi:MAG TPA: formate/nitrite transporter family protein [Zeimonas sp.]